MIYFCNLSITESWYPWLHTLFWDFLRSLSLSIMARSTLEILEGLFSAISRSSWESWWITKALDYETWDFSLPGEMTGEKCCFMGDSQGEPGELRREITWLQSYGDWVSLSSRFTLTGFICQVEVSIMWFTCSGERDLSACLKFLKGLTISCMQISEFSLSSLCLLFVTLLVV